MSITGGEFGETRLLQQRHLADELGLDGRIKQQWIPKINMLNYINSLQTPGLNMAFNTRPKKDYDVEIMWMNTCEPFNLADENCVRGGDEPSTNAHTYKLEKRIVKGFTIRDEEFRDNEYDADVAIAKTLIQIDKLICEEFAQYATARLNLFSGVNQVTDGKGVINPIDDTITDIDPSNWSAETMAYFSRVMQINRFDNAALISGSNLYETLFVANAQRGSDTGKGDYILWNGIPIWFDLFNVDSPNGNDLFTYLVSQGALATVSKAWNPAMAKYMDHYAYTMRSRFFPSFEYDVYYDNKCYNPEGETRYKDMVVHNWKIVLTADIFKNPYGCDAIEDDGVQLGGENTGILRFRNEVPALTGTPTPTPTP
jgi:hypothetical protein